MIEKDQKLVLEALIENPGSFLRDIHQVLAKDEEISRFQHGGSCSAPGPEACWNEEHYEIRDIMGELSDLGLAEVEGRGKPWYPTADGEEIVTG